MSCCTLPGILQDHSGHNGPLWWFCLFYFFPLLFSANKCWNPSENWPTTSVLDKPPCLLNYSPWNACAHPSGLFSNWWMDGPNSPRQWQCGGTFIAPGSISWPACTFTVRDDRGLRKARVASARENLLGLVVPAKPFAPDKRLLTNNSVSISQGLLSTNYFWIRKG